MFQNLSNRLVDVVKSVSGRGRLTEDNIKDALREVRVALLEADVALPVVKHFINAVRSRAVGQEVQASLSPSQTFIKIVNEELTALMGQANESLDLSCAAPAVILVAGLQGAGKTTTSAKLAHYLQAREKKKVMLASADVYRPAAIEQLKVLSEQIGSEFFATEPSQKPTKIAQQALQAARKCLADVLILDTAGRLHIDQEMMDEIQSVHAAVSPIETLFVVDSMIGQDAVNVAKAFNDSLSLTGVVLTKVDGDARGGAALSIRHVTAKPIKFLGVGEKVDGLEAFHPDRLASRILGMGDMLSMIEDIQQSVDAEQASKLLKKAKKGRGFDLSDLREQLISMQNMGGMASLVEKLPGMSHLSEAARQQAPEKQMNHFLAIIDSMTPMERTRPDVINGSRKRRIAAGSGTDIQAVNKLLKQHKQMGKMMKKFSKGGMNKMLQSLQGKFPSTFR